MQDDRGAAAVEFALVLPLLLMLVFGIVDFGRAYHEQVTLTHGAREGVRLLAFGGTYGDVQARLDDGTLLPGLSGEASINTAESTTCDDSADDAQLVLTDDFTFITPLPGFAVLYGGSAWSSTISMSGKAVMRCGG